MERTGYTLPPQTDGCGVYEDRHQAFRSPWMKGNQPKPGPGRPPYYTPNCQGSKDRESTTKPQHHHQTKRPILWQEKLHWSALPRSNSFFASREAFNEAGVDASESLTRKPSPNKALTTTTTTIIQGTPRDPETPLSTVQLRHQNGRLGLQMAETTWFQVFKMAPPEVLDSDYPKSIGTGIGPPLSIWDGPMSSLTRKTLGP